MHVPRYVTSYESSYFPGKVEEVGELTEKEIIRAERNAGFISDRVREIQVSKQVSSINGIKTLYTTHRR